MKRLLALAMSIAVLALAVTAAVDQRKPLAEAVRLSAENFDAYAPGGKEVDVIFGDFVLRNEHLVAVVADPVPTRNANMTVRNVAGALIDLTTRSDQSDQLAAFYPGPQNVAFRKARLIRGEQTADGNAVASADGPVGVEVMAAGTDNRPEVRVLYRLAPGQRYLEVVSTLTNTSDKALTVPLEDAWRMDGGKEDMVKAPNGTREFFWVHDRYWNQAYGVDCADRQIQSNSDARMSRLRYVDAGGQHMVHLNPGQSVTLRRRIFAARNLVNLRSLHAQAHGRSARRIRITIRDGGQQPLPAARIGVKRDGQPLGTANTRRDGTTDLLLADGAYTVDVASYGVTLARDLPLKVGPSSTEFRFVIRNYRSGRVVARITDEHDRPIPCKVEFQPLGDTPTPNFGPETAAFAVRNLRYAPLGTFQQLVPPGRYRLVISHGPEFDAVFREVTIPPAGTLELRERLRRSVDTTGWVSSDFHSHSSPSGDNTASQLGRVVNLVCEHIEFAPCTEHNRIDTYVPHIKKLQIEPYIATTSGIELTGQPLPLNHQNAFPLKRKPHTQDGGAPLTDPDPEKQIERLALWDNRSEKLVQQNHPDLGWLFFDKNGDGRPDGGYKRSFPYIDVIEIHPIVDALRLDPATQRGKRTYNNRIFNWLQLLNQGYRYPGVVNTDAHYNYHGSGGLRNWIRSSTDDPPRIDVMEMVRNATAGRLLMSNGPFLEVTASNGRGESAEIGQELSCPNRRVQLHVRAQCPNWFDIDRVFVLVNGRIAPGHDYRRATHADLFGSGPVKFDRVLELTLAGDAHIEVVAAGEKATLQPVLGPSWGKQQPVALTNPIYVDVDGGGFRANGDTLDAPLPVKLGVEPRR
ncbi:MAG: hypothetical protein D6725_01470 [Planctomycetota bacterium]|nr:MAG: hypothetical protein D6725_01470 [Planctomycetota bacterium]